MVALKFSKFHALIYMIYVYVRIHDFPNIYSMYFLVSWKDKTLLFALPGKSTQAYFLQQNLAIQLQSKNTKILEFGNHSFQIHIFLFYLLKG